jgi:glucoamylase
VRRATVLLVAAATVASVVGLTTAAPARAAGSAPDGPGVASTWNDPSVAQGFAGSTSAASKVWYDLSNGELTNAMYPTLDNPDTFGLQYYVTDGSTFTDDEVSNTSHAVALADSGSLTWRQTNTASNGDLTVTKTYVTDPNRSVILVRTTFDNLSSTPLYLYAQYSPQLNDQGSANSGGTDVSSGDLVAVNSSVASALAASTGFTETSTGYAGTASDGASMLTSSHGLTARYDSAADGHITQTAEIPVAASGSTTFTLALAFGGSESAAVSNASASLAAGFASAESSYESGWHSWLSGLTATPSSVTGNAKLEEQYEVALMELKADEDKTYVGGFVAAPDTPWGGAVSADTADQHGYHLVWTRDEYEMATALLAAGDTTDAQAALSYILDYEVESTGDVKQNSWLNGTEVWSATQMDQVADPIVLAYQLGDTDATTFAKLKPLANYLAANGPYTQEERWEEAGGYSPSTMAAEIAGLTCAATLATDNGDSSDAATWQAAADQFELDVDADTYTTSGPYGNGSYYLRIAPNADAPNASTTITLANGGGTYDQRDIVDPGFLELVRLGVKSPQAPQITNSIAVVDAQDSTTINGNEYWGRYNHDGYGEQANGSDYTGVGVGRDWPVLSGERGEYDIADGNISGARAMLTAMADAASPGYQISEQIWNTASADGFTEGQPDNSASPLMWAMAQYVRLALDISAGKDLDTPAVVAARYAEAKPVTETVDVTVPASTTSGATVYLAGNLSALGEGQPDWNPAGIRMTQVSATEWTTTLHAAMATTLQYKYDLNGTWNNVEETASCGYVDNRTMSVDNGTQSDTVATWDALNGC